MNARMTFEALGLSKDLLEALTKKGFEFPTPIQEKTIPLLLFGENDLVAQAQTGTGKTAAFGLPILDRIQPGLKKVQALILAPTRELAAQVAAELESYKANRAVRIAMVYGGQGMDSQLRQLKDGVDIVVGTPGRVIDHLNRKTLKLDHLKFVVLDEADEMLNMGFVDDIEEILEHTPEDKQMLLFSATMPPEILRIAENYMGEYDILRAEKQQQAAPSVEQFYYELYPADKVTVLSRIIDTENVFYGLIFCRTKAGADQLAAQLVLAGHDVEALHGDISQRDRERILAQFKRKKTTILVATDVAARGIDINDLTHVINFDLPGDAETYIHRSGRTGRAGKTGKAITFVIPSEARKWQFMVRDAKIKINRGTIPSIREVMDKKHQHMMEDIAMLIEESDNNGFRKLADDLFSKHDSAHVVSALLEKVYGKTMNPDSLREIREPRTSAPASKGYEQGARKTFTSAGSSSRSVPKKGGVEMLFFAKGRKDGILPKQLIQLVTEQSGIPASAIGDIDIFPRHTLFAVPSSMTETILSSFRTAKGERPLLRRDKAMV